MEPAVILLSGGIKSTATAMRILSEAKPHFLFVDFGHRAAKAERRAVEQISQALAGPLYAVGLPPVDQMVATSSTPEPGTAAATRVAARSERFTGTLLSMLATAQRLAERLGADRVVCGASEVSDAGGTPFERGGAEGGAVGAFFHAAKVAVELSSPSKQPVRLEVPFLHLGSTDIIRVAQRFGVPLHLTWSCEAGGEHPCEQCRGCYSRRAGFESLGITDPRLAAAT